MEQIAARIACQGQFTKHDDVTVPQTIEHPHGGLGIGSWMSHTDRMAAGRDSQKTSGHRHRLVKAIQKRYPP